VKWIAVQSQQQISESNDDIISPESLFAEAKKLDRWCQRPVQTMWYLTIPNSLLRVVFDLSPQKKADYKYMFLTISSMTILLLVFYFCFYISNKKKLICKTEQLSLLKSDDFLFFIIQIIVQHKIKSSNIMVTQIIGLLYDFDVKKYFSDIHIGDRNSKLGRLFVKWHHSERLTTLQKQCLYDLVRKPKWARSHPDLVAAAMVTIAKLGEAEGYEILQKIANLPNKRKQDAWMIEAATSCLELWKPPKS
jgi:hypothetical protein